MKVEFVRETPILAPPPVKAVNLTLTPTEYYDLKVLAQAAHNQLGTSSWSALQQARAASPIKSTYNIYGLLDSILATPSA